MSKRYLRCIFSYIVIVAICASSPAIKPKLDQAGNVKVFIEEVKRVGQDEVHFRVKLINGSASPVFLGGGPLLLAGTEDDLSVEQPYLEQWKDGEWHLIVPCLENAPPSVIRLNPGKTIIQDRVLTNPVDAPCKERHLQFEGKFRFRLEYFLSEQEAKANERNFGSSRVNLPAPLVAVSDSFEIPSM